MALIPYPDPEQLDDDVADAIAHFAGEHGRRTLLREMLAYSPPAMAAMEDLYHPVVEHATLGRPLMELLMVAASHARECRYCMGGHSRFLVEQFGYDQDTVERIRQGEAVEGLSEAERALVQLVRKAAAAAPTVSADDLVAVKEHGWTDEQIVEALTMACHAAWTNTFAQALHLEWDIDTPEFAGYF